MKSFFDVFRKVLPLLTLVGSTVLLSQTIQQNFWATNERGFAVEIDEVNNMLYLGGSFTRIGPRVGPGVRIDAQGNVVSGLDANDGIRDAVSDGNDGWFVCGDFTRLSGFDRTYIAHILSDGSVDPNWQVDCEYSIRNMHLAGGKLFVRGSFATINGQSRPRIAALNPANGDLLPWNPPGITGTGGSDSKFASQGDTLFVTRLPTMIGGTAYNNIVAFSISTGQALNWFPEPNSSANTLYIHDGILFLAGGFTEIMGEARSGAAAIDLAGDSLLPLNLDVNVANQVIRAFAASGNTLYVGGSFFVIGGQIRKNLAKVTISTGQVSTWNPAPNEAIIDLLVKGGLLYTSRNKNFSQVSRVPYLTTIDSATGAYGSFDPQLADRVFAMAFSGDQLFAVGDFSNAGGPWINALAQIDLNTGQATNWDADLRRITNAPSLLDIALDGNTLYIAGGFDSIGTAARKNLAAIDITTGQPTSFQADANDIVENLEIAHGRLYVSGRFDSLAGSVRQSIGAFDLAGGSLLSWNPNPVSGDVDAMAATDNSLIVGGTFFQIDGQVRSKIGELDLDGHLTSWLPDVDNNVSTVAVNNGRVYLSGGFFNINGVTRRRLGAIELSDGSTSDWDPGIDPSPTGLVSEFAFDGNLVYMVGNFAGIGGQNFTDVIAVDATTALGNGWGVNLNKNYGIVASASSITLNNNVAYIAGFFDWASSISVKGMVAVGLDLVAIEPGDHPQPVSNYRLYANYPNPFNPTTTIEFSLPVASMVTLEIFDNIGRHVETHYNASLHGGHHKFIWNATDTDGNPVVSGVYFYRLRIGDKFVQTRKMLLVR